MTASHGHYLNHLENIQRQLTMSTLRGNSDPCCLSSYVTFGLGRRHDASSSCGCYSKIDCGLQTNFFSENGQTIISACFAWETLRDMHPLVVAECPFSRMIWEKISDWCKGRKLADRPWKLVMHGWSAELALEHSKGGREIWPSDCCDYRAKRPDFLSQREVSGWYCLQNTGWNCSMEDSTQVQKVLDHLVALNFME
jgi:hypothetical protein